MTKMAKYAHWSKLTTQPGSQRDAVVGRAGNGGAGPFRSWLPDLRSLPHPWRAATVWLFEMFDGRESHDALDTLDQAAELGRRTMTLLAGPPEQAGLTVAGGKCAGAGQASRRPGIGAGAPGSSR
jgi:hypothetical protein